MLADDGWRAGRAGLNMRATGPKVESGRSTGIPGTGSQPLQGGELNQAITSALVGIHNKYLGRGPRSASTFYHDNVVVTLMHGVLTHAEKTLGESNHGEAVSQIRHLFQQTMDADFSEAVERLTGRKVVAFISGNNLDPDIAAEVFILDRSV
jgi:uncharacterized protein YbcI